MDKNFIISIPVDKVSGIQKYRVKAKTAKAALKQWHKHGGEFVGENFEVETLAEDKADVYEETEE